jgi:hypothetical protein
MAHRISDWSLILEIQKAVQIVKENSGHNLYFCSASLKLKPEGKGLDQSRTLNSHSTTTTLHRLVYQFQDTHTVQSQYTSVTQIYSIIRIFEY